MSETAVVPMNLFLPGDLRIVVPPQLSCLTTYVLLEQEDWFEDEIAFVRQHLQPGMRVIDVGANFGVYSLTAAARVGRSGHVWAVEPASGTVHFLSQSAALHPCRNISVIAAAISSRTGRGFLEYGNSAELYHLSAGQQDNVPEDAPSESGEYVRLTTLDEIQKELGTQIIDFLKLDAEGHEEEIIAGGLDFFTQQKPLVMIEVANDATNQLGAVDLFLARGYKLLTLIPRLNALVPVNRHELSELRTINAFVIHPDAISSWAARGTLIETPEMWPDDNDPSILHQYWQQQPWAEHFTETWQSWPDQEWIRILCLLLRIDDKNLPLALRYGCFLEAHAALAAIPEDQRHIGHHLAQIRLHLIAGNRVALINTTKNSIGYWQSIPENTAPPPLVLPYEKVKGHGFHETIYITLLHAMNNFMRRSSFYSADFTVEFGQLFSQTPGYDIDDERRFLLASALKNKAVPDTWPASDALKAQSPNADIWNSRVRFDY